MKEQLEFKEYRNYNLSFLILWVISFGVAFFWYDFFLERTYYKNRKALIRILRDRSFTSLIETDYLAFQGDIKTYTLNIKDESYRLWVWNTLEEKDRISLGEDLIGLFAPTPFAKKDHKNIIKLIKEIIKEDQYYFKSND